MAEKRYTVIHLGNPVECVIKDSASNNTIGVFSSMHNPVNEVVDSLNEKEEIIRELNRINSICENQINELRRLVNIATHNDFIKDSKKEEWKKELMRE